VAAETWEAIEDAWGDSLVGGKPKLIYIYSLGIRSPGLSIIRGSPGLIIAFVLTAPY
jgi:hypothetical protein